MQGRKMRGSVRFQTGGPASLDASSSSFFHTDEVGVNLVKLHGGLGEYRYRDGEIICNLPFPRSSEELIDLYAKSERMSFRVADGTKVPDGRDKVVTNSLGELDILTKAMLAGGKKYSRTSKFKKGEEKLKILDDVLRAVDEVVIMGYGFGDQHVNFRLSNAMVLNHDLRMQIVDPSYSRETQPKFLDQFDYDMRVRGARSTAAEWMYYSISGKWPTESHRRRADITTRREGVHQAVKRALSAGVYPLGGPVTKLTPSTS